MNYYIYTYEDTNKEGNPIAGFKLLNEEQKDEALAYIRSEYKRGAFLTFEDVVFEYNTLKSLLKTVRFEQID